MNGFRTMGTLRIGVFLAIGFLGSTQCAGADNGVPGGGDVILVKLEDCVVYNRHSDTNGTARPKSQAENAKASSWEADLRSLLKTCDFDSHYDADLELDERRIARESDPETKDNLLGWSDISKWTPTNHTQLLFWKAIASGASVLSQDPWEDAVATIRKKAFPPSVEEAMLVELACQRTIENRFGTSGAEEENRLESVLDKVSDPLRKAALHARCIRKIAKVPVMWSPDLPSGKQSEAIWMESWRITCLDWLLKNSGPQLQGNVVTSCRIARLIGMYAQVHRKALAFAKRTNVHARKKQYGPVSVGKPDVASFFESAGSSLDFVIDNDASLGLQHCSKQARNKWAAEFCKLMGKTDPKEVRTLDTMFLFQIADYTGDDSEKQEYYREIIASFPKMPKPVKPTISDEWRFETAGAELAARMAAENLDVGFVCHVAHDGHGSETNRIGYLVYSPKNASGKIPILVFFPGKGEIGGDLSKVFQQRTILDKIRSEAFQKKHPCHLLVLSPPDGTQTLSGDDADGGPTHLQRALHDTLLAVARTRKRPAVDENRIYVTGLSMGGTGAYSMTFVYPGLFAASAPVSPHIFAPDVLRNGPACNYFHLWNEGEAKRMPEAANRLDAFGRKVRELGGDFFEGTFPNEGHNAWDSAWLDDSLWEWMFSKRIGENGLAGQSARAAKNGSDFANGSAADRRPTITASQPGRDGKTGPERAADGLDGTAYVSIGNGSKEDWIHAEWKEPATGKFQIRTGWPNGDQRLGKALVEISHDGKSWSRIGMVSAKTGVCTFQHNSGIRYLRIIPDPKTDQPIVVREITVTP